MVFKPFGSIFFRELFVIAIFQFLFFSSNLLIMVLGKNAAKILSSIPRGVSVVCICKGRTSMQINSAIDHDVKILGWNYVQELEKNFPEIRRGVEHHFVGHLQSNKVKKVLNFCSCIQSVDSFGLAEEIDKVCGKMGKKVSVLVEVNLGNEESKFGILPENVLVFVKKISSLKNISVSGLMAIEPFFENPENSRQYFRKLKSLFDKIKSENIPNVDFSILSMGMSNTCSIAVEEGSNMVRIGRAFFD